MTATYSDWGDLFYGISPYTWAYLGIGIALGASVVGAAWYHLFLFQGYFHHRCQHSQRCRQVSTYQIQKSCQVLFLAYFSVIFCEAVAIYGVIMAIILQGKINVLPPPYSD